LLEDWVACFAASQLLGCLRAEGDPGSADVLMGTNWIAEEVKMIISVYSVVKQVKGIKTMERERI
jgi:hypothetical protein